MLWRLGVAALILVFGLYLAADAYYVNAGLVEAALLLGGGSLMAWTVVSTSELGDLFDLEDARPIREVVLLLVIIGAFYNAPAANACRQKAYASLGASVALDRRQAWGADFTSDDEHLADQVLKACSLAPVGDFASLTSQLQQAQSDYEIAGAAEIEPGFIRRLLSWDSAEHPSPCILAYRELRNRFPHYFDPEAGSLECLELQRSRFHL